MRDDAERHRTHLRLLSRRHSHDAPTADQALGTRPSAGSGMLILVDLDDHDDGYATLAEAALPVGIRRQPRTPT